MWSITLAFLSRKIVAVEQSFVVKRGRVASVGGILGWLAISNSTIENCALCEFEIGDVDDLVCAPTAFVTDVHLVFF